MNNMSKKKGVFWLVLSAMMAMTLMAGPDLWAAPGQSSARQTVPTRTPTPGPTTPSPTEPPLSPTNPPPTTKPMPTPTALVMSSTASDATLAESSSEPFLPEAGGRGVHLHLSAAMIAAGLLILVMVGRRAQKKRQPDMRKK